MGEVQDKLFRLVRENRDQLRRLLPREEADRVMLEVDRLLEEGPEAAVRLRLLLQDYEPVKAWLTLSLFWEEGQRFSLLRQYISIIDDPDVSSLRYVCPCRGCDYEEKRLRERNPPPLCPEHKAELVLVLVGEEAQKRDCDA